MVFMLPAPCTMLYTPCPLPRAKGKEHGVWRFTFHVFMLYGFYINV
jgi:hypothetical protein